MGTITSNEQSKSPASPQQPKPNEASDITSPIPIPQHASEIPNEPPLSPSASSPLPEQQSPGDNHVSIGSPRAEHTSSRTKIYVDGILKAKTIFSSFRKQNISKESSPEIFSSTLDSKENLKLAEDKLRAIFEEYNKSVPSINPMLETGSSFLKNFEEVSKCIHENNRLIGNRGNENYLKLLYLKRFILNIDSEMEETQQCLTTIPETISGIQSLSETLDRVFHRIEELEELLLERMELEFTRRFHIWKGRREEKLAKYEKEKREELTRIKEDLLKQRETEFHLVIDTTTHAQNSKSPEFVDQYGFSVDPDEIELYNEFNGEKVLQRDSKLWQDALDGLKSPYNPTDLMSLIETIGIPPHLRKTLWPNFFQIDKLKEKYGADYYAHLSRQNFPRDENFEAIKKDVQRTFPDNELFTAQEKKLKRLLLSYATHNPEVGYAQSMNFICGMLTLVIDDEDTVFWCLCSLIDNILPKFYVHNLFGALVDQKVVDELVALELPRVFRHIVNELPVITIPWLLCLFLNALPVETSLCILDNIICKGSFVLITVVLAILKILEREILSWERKPHTINLIKRASQKLYDRQLLLKVTASYNRMIPVSMVQSLREKYSVSVEKKLTKMESRRSAFNFWVSASNSVLYWYTINRKANFEKKKPKEDTMKKSDSLIHIPAVSWRVVLACSGLGQDQMENVVEIFEDNGVGLDDLLNSEYLRGLGLEDDVCTSIVSGAGKFFDVHPRNV